MFWISRKECGGECRFLDNSCVEDLDIANVSKNTGGKPYVSEIGVFGFLERCVVESSDF